MLAGAALFILLVFQPAAHAGTGSTDGVTIITHGWNLDMTGIPAWLTSMEEAISANYLGGKQNFGTITVTNSGTGLVATCSPWNIDLTSKKTGGIVIILDWSSVADHLTGGPSIQAVAQVVVDKIVDGQDGLPPLAELPIHLIGHSRGGALMAELARLLGEQGVVVDQLTMLDPHPLTEDDAQIPFSPVIDAQPAVSQNVVFADDYWQDYQYPTGQAVDGAYTRQRGQMAGGYYNNPGAVFPNHRNIYLMYQATIDPNNPVNNGEASMGAAERAAWFDDYEKSGAKTGFYYSRMGGGDRSSTDTPVAGGDQVNAGLNDDPAFGGGGSRQALTWSDAAWANIAELQVMQDGAPLGPGSHTVTAGSNLSLSYVALDYANASSITFHADSDSNPYNGNDIGIIGSVGVAATGASYSRNTETWDASAMPEGQPVYVYAEITDSVTGNTRYFYAPTVLTFRAGAAVSYTATATAGANGSLDSSTPSPQTVDEDSTASFVFDADPGYYVANVNGCDGTYSNSSDSVMTYTYTTGPVTEDCTVSASFAALKPFSKIQGTEASAFAGRALPLLDSDPDLAEPIGLGPVAEGGDTIRMRVGLAPFSEPADLYFIVYTPPSDPDGPYVLDSGGSLRRLSDGMVPWKKGVTGAVDENLLGDIPVSSLPKGTYDLCLMATPSGTTDSYLLWETSLVVPPADTMPLPSGGHSFTVPSPAFPVVSADPSKAVPVSFGSFMVNGKSLGLSQTPSAGDSMDVRVRLASFSGPVDLYLGIYAPRIDPSDTYILNSGGTFRKLSGGLVPWKKDVTGGLNADLFGDIPVSSLPSGTYTFYLATAPAGRTDSYYLWTSSVTIP